MTQLYFTFTSVSETEYNDTVYNQLDALDFEPVEYAITLSPFSSTKYWRFGLALSREITFEFNPSQGRYSNQELRYIEVDVGDRPLASGAWIYPNRIALGCYYFSLNSPVVGYDTYVEESEVELRIKIDAEANVIEVVMKAPGCPLAAAQFPFDGYRFVKFFAWADHTSYELGCSIQIRGREEEVDFEQYPSAAEATDRWLLKLEENSPGKIDYGTDLFGYVVRADGDNMQVDEDYFGRLKKGATVLGYQVQLQVVSCSLQFEEFLPPDHNGPGIAKFRFMHYFRSYIQMKHLLGHIVFWKLLNAKSPYRLINLSGRDLGAILAKDYAFPEVQLTADERKYLEIVYDNWLLGREINTSYSLREIWSDFPDDFAPEKISQLLLLGRSVTLWGISQIHPESDIFDKFDLVVRTIKGLLSEGVGLDRITATQILRDQKQLDEEDISRVFKLMVQFPDMARSLRDLNAGGATIELGEDRFYATYNRYKGLKEFMRSYLTGRGIQYNGQTSIFSSGGVVDEEPASYRTELRYRDRSKFGPVMGVKTLAFDMANVIMRLQREKGQMVGIFGKWGRGKTFFLQQIWGELEKSKEIRFIRITFDAWKYQETPGAWAYLYEKLLEAYLGKPHGKNFLCYGWRLFLLNVKRNRYWPIVKFLAAVATTVASWFLPWKKYILVAIPTSVLALAYILSALRKEYSAKAITLVKKYAVRPGYKGQLGIQADIQAELIKLLEVWVPKKKIGKLKILLEVEDIDRCRQEKIIENIDGLRTLLEDDAIADRLIIVTTIDERILKSAIYAKYEAVETNNEKQPEESRVSVQELIIEQLDKIFITAIKLADLLEGQREEFIDALLSGEVEKKVENDQPQAEKKALPVMNSDSGRFSSDAAGLRGENNFPEKNDSLVSISKVEEDGPEPLIKGYPADSWQKLTNAELQSFKELARSWTSVTPRKLWIFYYRYLLCKNLLIGKYIKEGRENHWQTRQGSRDLIMLLKYFGELHQPAKIAEEQKRINSLQKSQIEIDLQMGLPKIRTSSTDYLQLLHILEMVIAY